MVLQSGVCHDAPVEVVVSDNPAAGRFEARVGGELAGAAFYRLRDGVLAFTHTEVADAHEGQGVGSRLAAAALAEARARGLAVRPFCPFIRGYIERHPEHLDLVPDDERGRFRL